MRSPALFSTTAWAATLGVALCLAGVPLHGQQGSTIRGTVTQQGTMRPIQGVQVSMEGTGRGSITDATGAYRITSVPPGSHSVRAQIIGFGSQTRSITVQAGQTLEVNFELQEAAVDIDEIVVVGYGTQSRRGLAAAVATVQADEIRQTPLAGIDAALQGRAAGVQVVQNAGNPGNGITVRVRGSSSISAGNQPLWVIDGVPMFSEDFSQLGMGGQNISAVTSISPEDIESIDILKDAAATAIYGSRGSNGVVMVTTRRGHAGAPTIDFSAYTGTQEASRRLDLLNAEEYLEYFNESAANDGRNPQLYGVPGVDDQIYTDWQDAVLRSAPVSSYELGMAGGDDRVRYRVSGTYFDQEGIVIGSQYQRASGRATLDYSTSDRVHFSASLSFAREDNDRIENDGSTSGIITNTVGNPPLVPLRRDDGEYAGIDEGLVYPNAVALATYNTAEALTRRTTGNIEGRFDLLEAVRLTSRLGVDFINVRETQYESPLVSGTYAASADGIAKSGFSSGDRYTIDNFLTFDHASGGHELTVTAGNSVELNDRELNFVRGEGLSSEQFRHVRNAATIVDADATASEYNLVSFFGRASYTLLDRYTLGLSIRHDGSSRFGANNRYGTFPSISAAWAMSEESALSGIGWMNELKLRGSWGITGNQAVSNYPFQGLVGSANYGDQPGLRPSTLENPDLKWESTVQTNLGLDLLVLDGRLGMRGDVYHKDTRDLLLSRPITTTSGFSSVFDNVGNIENRGWELELSTVNVRSGPTGDLGWTTSFNVAANRNEVTKLANDEPFNSGTRSVNRVEVGQPLGVFHMVRFLGVDPETGDAIYEDVAGEADDRQIVGSPHPDYTGGLTNRLSWNGFDLNVFLQFAQGHEIFNAMRLFSDAGAYYYDNHFRDVLRRWRQPGDVTDQPRASYGGRSGARTISSRFIEDGSYVRLQDVTIGYRLPASVSRVAALRDARIYVSGQNLHTWTDYSGYNPDVNSSGSGTSVALGTDFYAYPLARTITFGIRGSW
jgi:TonB-linked SusC/RagA family outer membrane protein